MTDEEWMRRALGVARLAAQRGEVPIGCLIVRDGRLLASAHDGKELFWDPTCHAEMMAIRRAASVAGDWRLYGTTMYVTLEPCPMCAGALIHARVERLVYGASNPRWGTVSAGLNILDHPAFNHRVEVAAGVLEQECGELLRETFRLWREAGKQSEESL